MPAKLQTIVNPPGSFDGLPQELAEFLSKDTYSLLIKGESGTGKTILALSILKALQPIENPLFISTRTSPLQLVENYPWLEEIFGPAGMREKEGEGWDTLVDARLDEPNIVFERITNVLMDRQAPTVVMDSWEALSDTLGSEALRTNIRVLQTWRERAGARFIFIGEDPGNTAIDYMVEGAVVLKDRVADGRRLREIVLSKLHGVQISRPSYFFTLQGGMFRSFPPYSARDYDFRKPLPVTFDRPFRRIKSRYPSGYPSLDSTLDGGFPAKSTAILDVGKRVDPRVAVIFLSRSIQDWLLSGDQVILGNLREVDPAYLRQFAKSFGGGKGSLTLKGKTAGTGSREKRAKTKAKTMIVAEAGSMESQGKSEDGSRRDLTLIVGKEEDIGEDSSKVASVYIKVRDIGGTLFLECEAPWSSLYGVVPTMTGGNPMLSLEPVV